MATDDADRAHPAAGGQGRDTSHDDGHAAAPQADDGGSDDGGSDTDGTTSDGATSDGTTSDGTASRYAAPDEATAPDAADGAHASAAPPDPAVAGNGGPRDGVGDGTPSGGLAAPGRDAFGGTAAALPPAASGQDDPDGLPRFLASLDFGPAAGEPAPAVTHDRNRRALVLVSSVAAVAVAGLVGAFAALNTSAPTGPQNGPHPAASNGAMLATGSQGPNRFTPPYFGQPTTGAGKGNGDTRPRTRSSAPPSASSSRASPPPTHRPSQGPSTTPTFSSPSSPVHISCAPLPTLLRGAAPDILCPQE